MHVLFDDDNLGKLKNEYLSSQLNCDIKIQSTYDEVLSKTWVGSLIYCLIPNFMVLKESSWGLSTL